MSILHSEEANFHVVVNHEEQYSVGPTTHELPAGWHRVGETGERRECLEYVEQVWSDQRQQMDAARDPE